MRRSRLSAIAIGTVVLVSAGLSSFAMPAALAGARAVLRGPILAVDAVTAQDVWAVGTAPDPQDPDEDIGLAEHWNGAAWTEVPTPDFNDHEGSLVDVSFSGSADGWAVGSEGPPLFRDTQVVVEHWNGTQWTLSPAPDASFHDFLAGVAAVSPSDVWAVGAYSTGGTGVGHILIEHWNGTSWRIVPTPDLGFAQLLAARALAADDVWATGIANAKTLAMHWDGLAWSIVPTPNRGTASQSLTDVDASGPNDVWAVGEIEAGQPFVGKTLAMHWDGQAWKLAATPSPSSGDTVGGVAVLPSGTAWMAGTFWPTATVPRGLTERFVDGAWKVVRVPGSASLDDVAAPGADDAWAVGSGIFHWDGRHWTLVLGT